VTAPPDDDSPYHRGERAVQQRAGVRDRSEQLGRKMIRAFMPEQHRQFFREQRFVLIGCLDAQGNPWASMLVGSPGFAHSPEPETLVVRALPTQGDPLAQALRPGAALGVLGIQPETRRRNRVNGRVSALGADGFALRVDQSFGNCPKYITARSPVLRTAVPQPVAAQPESSLLSASALECIARADTCFIASASSDAAVAGSVDRRQGADVSHRGGRPGFIAVGEADGASVLRMPDYAGNNAFNTLGNIASYPRAGLLFPDFDRGHVLLLTCDAEIRWQPEELERVPDAERLVVFRVRSGVLLPNYMPFVWSAPERVQRSGS
jgi:uncharacterized protein